MRDLICDEFQNTVSELIIRHQSMLDILSKLSEASARVNRAVTKSVTTCGCIKVEAERTALPDNIQSIGDLKAYLDSHVRGHLCPQCEDIVVTELGNLLFFMTALCNTLDISLYDVFIKEYKNAYALGIYNLK